MGLTEIDMGKEIERKYLVKGDSWRALGEGIQYRQGYLSTAEERSVRVRTVNGKAYLTVKGETRGIARMEYDYEIPLTDANELLDEVCERPLIEKTRYTISTAGHIWEIDEFDGENRGLIVAEVELASEEQTVDLPDWVGTEVSDDPRYYNANLIANPYTRWD